MAISAPQPAAPASGLSGLLGHFRWLFMPLGLVALVAVGIHAAADTVDDKLLWAVDRAQAGWDSFWGQWDWASRLVSPLGLSARTRLARGFTLLWELGADWVLALPAFGYRESDAPQPSSSVFRTMLPRPAGWKHLFQRWFTRPTVMRWTRPWCTAAMALAGACAVAQMVQGELYLGLRGETSEALAGPVARFAAVLTLGLVAVSLGWRAVLRSVQHADAESEDPTRVGAERVLAGLVGSLWVLPLAVAALLDASPVLSFFR